MFLYYATVNTSYWNLLTFAHGDALGNINFKKLKASDLPDDWTREPPQDSTKDIRSNWVKAGTAVLKVPSVLVPRSWNYVLNPAHRDFKKICISDPLPFVFDARMS